MLKAKEEGITLYALVITVLILIIFAAVSINVTYNTGIVDTATNELTNYMEEVERQQNKMNEVQEEIENRLLITINTIN